MTSSLAPRLDIFKDYEYEVDLKSDAAAAAVIRFVSPGSKVLEIGAGSGAIARHIVSTKKCKVTAVEINPASVKKLRKICESVHSLDLNNATWSDAFSKTDRFDYVIAADVLEHLYDPWTVLRNMKTLLRETGRVILSLPHAGHSAVVANFYCGDIEYGEWGLLDKTHIRFFGMRNIEALYESAGLAIVRCHFVVRKPEHTEFAKRWKALPYSIREALGNRSYANIYQIVTEAVPVERAKNRLNFESCSAELPKPKTFRNFLDLFGK
jgi:2-polyprenyl-3-methyl-5-hydroxy-6-metoxy-1,4-benzoquinol methylase